MKITNRLKKCVGYPVHWYGVHGIVSFVLYA